MRYNYVETRSGWVLEPASDLPAEPKRLWTSTTCAQELGVAKRSVARCVDGLEEEIGLEVPRIMGHNGTGLMLFTWPMIEAMKEYRKKHNQDVKTQRGRGRRAWHGNSKLMAKGSLN